MGVMRLTVGLVADGAEGCSAPGLGGNSCWCVFLGRAIVWVGRARVLAAADVEKDSDEDKDEDNDEDESKGDRRPR